MKTDRKVKTEKSPPKAKAVPGSRSATRRKTNGKHPLAASEHISVGIVEASLDGKYIDMNEEFCRILGYPRKELLKLGIKDCTHEDDYSLDIRLHEQLVAGRIPFYKLEKRYVRKDGSHIWVELSRSLACDENDNPHHTVGVVLDISDRKDVERVLRDSVERLRIATGAARMFMWEWDPRTDIYTADDNFEKVLGFSGGLLPKDAIESVQRLMPPEDSQALNDTVAKAIESRRDQYSIQLRVINPENGETVWLELNAKIVYDDQGNALRMFGVTQNITENKKRLEEIAIISRLPAQSPNPVMRLTPEGKILYANDASAPLLEAWLQNMKLVIPAELQNAIQETFAAGVTKDIELENHGTYFSCTLAPIREAGYINFYGKDITEHKQALEALGLARERAEHTADRITRLQKVTAALSEALTPSQVAEVVVKEGAPALGAVSSSMLLLSGDGQTLELTYSTTPERVVRPYQRFPLSLNVPSSDAVRSGQPVWIESQAQYLERYPHLEEQIKLWGQQAALAVPMTYEDHILGVLTLSFDRVLHPTPEDKDYVLALAQQSAQALQRARAEADLRQSEERFRQAANASNALVYEVDLVSGATAVVYGMESLVGYDSHEIAASSDWWHSLIHPDDLPAHLIQLEQLLNHAGSDVSEYRLRHKNGEWIIVQDNRLVIQDETGASVRLVGAVIDITERKRAEEQLRAKEAELEEVINETPFMLTRCTRDLRYRFVSRAYAEMIGRIPEEVAGKPIVEIMGVDGLKTITPYIEKVLQGEQVEYETEVSFQGIGTPFLHVVYTPDWDEQGNVIGWFESIMDISERKHAEAALRIENERFMRFVNSNIVGILIGNASGEVTLANDYYLNLLGLSREDFMDRKVDWKAFTPPEWAHADEKAIRELRERGVCEPYEKEYVRTDGARVPVYIADAMLPGPGEEIAAFVLDISERKRAEETLRRNEELFSMLVEAAPFGVYFIDSEFRLRAINKGSEAVFRGIHPLIGRDFAEILRIVWAEPFATEAIERFRHTLRTGESFISPPTIEPRANIEEIQSYDWQIHRITMPDGTYGVVCYFYDLSEQKRMEAAVRTSEALYRAIARNIPGGGVYVVDQDYRYIVAEGPVTEAFGLTREMLEGRTIAEVFPNDEGKQMEDRLRQTFAGEIVSFETKFNGRVYWTQQAPLQSSIGQAIILTIDITERKQAEEAFRQSEERFAQFMQHLPGLAWIKDLDGRYIYANAAAEKAFNTPQEQLYGRMDDEIFPADVAAQFRRNDAQAFSDEKGIQVIETLKQDDGVLHYSLVSKFPIPGPDGNTALIGGTAFDITERKQAEEALRESEERFRAILKQATAGIVRKDTEGKLIFVNQAFCNMLGYTEADLLNKSMWDLMPREDADENRELFDRMMMEGVPFKLERRLIREDGSIIWVDASVSPIMDVDGKPQSAVAVEVDITARKQAEEALQQLNLQLEDRILSRTAKLRAVNQTLREEIAERQRMEEALRLSEATARESEEKLRTLFDLLPVGISFLNLQGKIIQMNSALPNILKLSREQLLSKSYATRKYIRADGAPMQPEEFASARALTEGVTIHNVETGIVLENGEVIWTNVSAAPVDVGDVSVVVVTVDITDSKRAERALQESHRRLRVLSQRLVEVQEDERRALARELHDRVGQTLAALNINLIIINSQLTPEVGQQIGTRLNDSMQLVAETIALVRDVMTDLRPAVLDDYGLEAAIESHLSRFTSRYNIAAKFAKPSEPLPRLGPSIEMTFLRIAQEALINIARHAQATQVNLSLWQKEDAVHMLIQDNGIGIESWQEANRPGSHGLTIMRERAEAFDGNLRVKSVPRQGTKIEVSIPRNAQSGARQEKPS